MVYPPGPVVDVTDRTQYRGEVAFGAHTHCAPMAYVEWNVCGRKIAQTTLPVDIDMPAPIDMSLTFVKGRLAQPDDPASKAPISVDTSTQI